MKSINFWIKSFIFYLIAFGYSASVFAAESQTTAKSSQSRLVSDKKENPDIINMSGMHQMPGMYHMGMVHDHVPITIPKGVPTPQIELALFKDSMSGFNLHLKLANFKIDPPEFEQPVKALANGHAHLYINGKKIQRVYGHYVHIPASLLVDGVNLIMVSLNAHNHNVWTFDNKQLLASVAIQNSLPEDSTKNLVLKSFSSSPMVK